MATNDDPRPVIDNRPSNDRPSNGGSRPVPDPTVLTDKAIEKSERSLREYIDSQLSVRDERLNGIDTATKLRLAEVDRMPVQVDEKIAALDRVVQTQFDGIQTQFKERDERSKQESVLNKTAVDAAFAAQKEAATKQDEANQKAIDKSEKSTADTIKTNQESNKLITDGLTKGLDENKQSVTRIESAKVGATENRSGLYAAIGIVGTILGILIAASTVIAILKP